MLLLSVIALSQEGVIPVGVTSTSNPHYLEPLESNYLPECYTSLAKKGAYLRLSNPKTGMTALFIVRGSIQSGTFGNVTVTLDYFSLLKDANNSTFNEYLYCGVVSESDALTEIATLKENDEKSKIRSEEFAIRLAENKRVRDSISDRLEANGMETSITYYAINNNFEGALANITADTSDTGYSQFGGFSAASSNIPVGTFLRVTYMEGTRYEKVIYVEVVKKISIQHSDVDLIVFKEAYKSLGISIAKKQCSVIYEIISKEEYLTLSNQDNINK